MHSLAMVPRKGNSAISTASARITECDCRQGVLDLPLFSRVATTQDSVPKYSNLTRSVPSRPFCYMFKLPSSSALELVARPIHHGYRCIPSLLDKSGMLFLLFSSLESETRAKHPDHHSPGLAGTGVVPPPSGTASPASSVAPKPPIPPQTSLQAATPTIKDATTSTSHPEVSGTSTWQTELQSGRPDLSLLDGAKTQTLPTNQPGKMG